MKTTLLVLALLTSGSLFGQISIGIRIGPPPPPRIVRVRPVSPGPGYLFTEGYWYPVGSRYKWHEGYWTRPPYEGAAWVEPHYDGEYYRPGRWDGPRGHVDHDHHWDRNRDRDYGRGDKHDHDDSDHDHGHHGHR